MRVLTKVEMRVELKALWKELQWVEKKEGRLAATSVDTKVV